MTEAGVGKAMSDCLLASILGFGCSLEGREFTFAWTEEAPGFLLILASLADSLEMPGSFGQTGREVVALANDLPRTSPRAGQWRCAIAGKSCPLRR